MANYWLFKSEPDVFSIDHLKEWTKKYGGVSWEGVRNYQARNFMRDCKKGDVVLFYHSNCKPPGIVGVAKIVREAYPDPDQFDPNAKYFDPKSSFDKPRWSAIEMAFVSKFAEKISLEELKNTVALSSMRLVQKGNRLSVMPVTKEEFDVIVKTSKSSPE